MALTLSKAGRRYGAWPSTPNPLEHGFPAHLIQQKTAFPPRAGLTGTIGPTKDQGSEGSCTAHGSTALGERLYRRWQGVQPVFSPAFTYYLERQAEGTLAQGDAGAQVVTSVSIPDMNPGAGGYGWCPIENMPYVAGDFSTAPTAAQIAAARLYPGGAYHNIGNVVANMKSCILSDYSFVIGISVYDSFEADSTASSGLIPFPDEMENLLGGHEVHAGIGYDDSIQCPNSPNKGAILIQNSWGTGWGIKCPFPCSSEGGFAWISYDYLMSPQLTSDVRMAHLGRAW